MIRFRFQEDEQRYLRLISEMYRDIAANLPPAVSSRVLRNLGKIEQILHLEGVRQGMAIAELSMLSEKLDGPIDVHHNKPFQAHAMVYGSSDTPLHATEKEWLGRMGANEDHASHAWLEGHPMRFAPQTLEETLQEDRGAAQESSAEEVSWLSEDLDARPLSSDDVRRMLRVESDYDDDSAALSEEEGGGPPVESPSFLDGVRDAIQTMQQGGKEFSSWQDLVMSLHLHMAADAAFLDLQLATDFGRTVLDQCGLYNLRPGHSINLSNVQTPDDEKGAHGGGT